MSNYIRSKDQLSTNAAELGLRPKDTHKDAYKDLNSSDEEDMREAQNVVDNMSKLLGGRERAQQYIKGRLEGVPTIGQLREEAKKKNSRADSFSTVSPGTRSQATRGIEMSGGSDSGKVEQEDDVCVSAILYINPDNDMRRAESLALQKNKINANDDLLCDVVAEPISHPQAIIVEDIGDELEDQPLHLRDMPDLITSHHVGVNLPDTVPSPMQQLRSTFHAWGCIIILLVLNLALGSVIMINILIMILRGNH